MSYLLDDLKNDVNWNLFYTAWEKERFSHAVAFRLPEGRMEAFLDILQNLFLGKGLSEKSPPASPDIHIIGDIKSPPSIDMCRMLASELSFFPLCLKHKIGIVCHGDALSLPGANSLLKITEEPPEHCLLVFLYSQRTLLPTLESRVWNLPLSLKSEKKREPLFLGKKDGTPSQKLEIEFLEKIYEKGLLTKPLAEDMLCLIMKEDYSFGEVFNSIW